MADPALALMGHRKVCQHALFLPYADLQRTIPLDPYGKFTDYLESFTPTLRRAEVKRKRCTGKAGME